MRVGKDCSHSPFETMAVAINQKFGRPCPLKGRLTVSSMSKTPALHTCPTLVDVQSAALHTCPTSTSIITSTDACSKHRRLDAQDPRALDHRRRRRLRRHHHRLLLLPRRKRAPMPNDTQKQLHVDLAGIEQSARPAAPGLMQAGTVFSRSRGRFVAPRVPTRAKPLATQHAHA